MNSFAILPVADRLALTLDGLMRAVAACSDRRRPGGAMASWLIVLIWTRVSRSHQRIQRLLARFQAGRLRVVTATRPAAVRERPGATVKERIRAEGKVPRGMAWLLPLVPCEAANFASQLRHTLADPEMVALLMASPQARRVLAPLCRMLGIEASVLTPSGEIVAQAPPEISEVGRSWTLGVSPADPVGSGPRLPPREPPDG